MSADPQVCSTLVNPMTPSCFGSTAIVVSVSAAVFAEQVVERRLVLESDCGDRRRQGEDVTIVGERQ